MRSNNFYSYTSAEDVNNKAFPEDFLFGTATASYQVEGKSKYTSKCNKNKPSNLIMSWKNLNDVLHKLNLKSTPSDNIVVACIPTVIRGIFKK